MSLTGRARMRVGGLWLCSLLVLASACASSGFNSANLQARAVSGGRLQLLPDSYSPVLVVNSPSGIGKAELILRQPLPDGLIIEFPGFKRLEGLALARNGRALVCHGVDEAELACSWGEEWPVGKLRRHANGMTLLLPAMMFTQPGEWHLQWVDFYR